MNKIPSINLFEFPIGKVVKIKHEYSFGACWGHVVGFAVNPTGETILEVQTETGSRLKIHPGNVTTF